MITNSDTELVEVPIGFGRYRVRAPNRGELGDHKANKLNGLFGLVLFVFIVLCYSGWLHVLGSVFILSYLNLYSGMFWLSAS